MTDPDKSPTPGASRPSQGRGQESRADPTAHPAVEPDRPVWAPDLAMAAALPVRAWDRVLVLRSGDGRCAEEIWRRLGRGFVCGLERSAALTARASRLRGVEGCLEFRAWPEPRLPAPARSFDRVVSCVPLTAYPDPRGILTEVRRVLRPHGEFHAPFSARCDTVYAELVALLTTLGFTDVRVAGDGELDPAGCAKLLSARRALRQAHASRRGEPTDRPANDAQPPHAADAL